MSHRGWSSAPERRAGDGSASGPASDLQRPNAEVGVLSSRRLRSPDVGCEQPCEVRTYLACSSWDGAGAGEKLLHRLAAARTISGYRRKAQRSDVRVTAIPPGRRAGTRRAGFRRRASALVGLPAGHRHYCRRRAGDQQPDFPGTPRAAALRAAGQRVPVRRGGPRRAPDPAAAAAGATFPSRCPNPSPRPMGGR